MVICLSADPSEKTSWDPHTRDTPQDTLGVDDEETTESDTLFLNQDAVIPGDFHGAVCKKRQSEIGTKATLLTRLVSPRKMGVFRVGGYSKDFRVEFLELGESVVEGDDLSWANEGKVPEKHK